jgi:DNA ligase (NAD+)
MELPMLSFAQGKQLAKEMFVLGSYEDFPVSKIVEVLTAADELYFNDEETFLDDAQYDALKMYAQRLAPADVYFTGVGSAVRGGKIDLPFKMGSLNQVYQGDYTKWVEKHAIQSKYLIVSDKLDGASVMLVYGVDGKLQIAYSRGDGIQGADITRHATKIHNVPQQIDNKTGKAVAVRAENIISPKSFAKVNTGKFARGGRIYKNPRNMVSGLMNSSENHPEVYKAIDTVVYEIVGSSLSKTEQLDQLHNWGFNIVRHSIHVAANLDDDKLTALLNTRRNNAEYELDGVVIDIDNAQDRIQLASDELNPEYAVKFKVADASNFAVATVRGVEWNLSKDGYYKPRVQIHPVDLVGVTIQNLTGFNAKFIRDSGIGPGAKIQITRSGDVIPFILGVVEPVTPQLPDDDTAVWTDTGVDLIVANASKNATVLFERLNDFFSSIDAPHLGDGNLMKMFEMGFDTPEKIIELTQQDISSLVKSAAIGKKIHAGLRDKLTNIPIYVLMGSHHAFGRGVGMRKMKKLYEAFEGDMTKCKNIEAIVAVDGFDVKTATKIAAGYAEFLTFLAAVNPYITLAKYEAKKQGHLTGKVFVFTGFRSKELEDKIINAGGTMGSTVSSKTTYLVTAEPNSTSGKAVKAREIGVQVIGQAELEAML